MILLEDKYLQYFDLYLVLNDKKILRKFCTYDAPYMTFESATAVQNDGLSIHFRKNYWRSDFDEILKRHPVSRELLENQMANDVKKEIRKLKSNNSNSYNEINQNDNCLQFKDCICDYPVHDSPCYVLIGTQRIDIIHNTGTEHYFLKKLRSWRLSTLTGPSGDYEELAFEYLSLPHKYQWFNILSSQAVFISDCLRRVLEEMIVRNDADFEVSTTNLNLKLPTTNTKATDDPRALALMDFNASTNRELPTTSKGQTTDRPRASSNVFRGFNAPPNHELPTTSKGQTTGHPRASLNVFLDLNAPPNHELLITSNGKTIDHSRASLNVLPGSNAPPNHELLITSNGKTTDHSRASLNVLPGLNAPPNHELLITSNGQTTDHPRASLNVVQGLNAPPNYELLTTSNEQTIDPPRASSNFFQGLNAPINRELPTTSNGQITDQPRVSSNVFEVNPSMESTRRPMTSSAQITNPNSVNVQTNLANLSTAANEPNPVNLTATTDKTSRYFFSLNPKNLINYAAGVLKNIVGMPAAQPDNAGTELVNMKHISTGGNINDAPDFQVASGSSVPTALPTSSDINVPTELPTNSYINVPTALPTSSDINVPTALPITSDNSVPPPIAQLVSSAASTTTSTNVTSAVDASNTGSNATSSANN